MDELVAFIYTRIDSHYRWSGTIEYTWRAPILAITMPPPFFPTYTLDLSQFQMWSGEYWCKE